MLCNWLFVDIYFMRTLVIGLSGRTANCGDNLEKCDLCSRLVVVLLLTGKEDSPFLTAKL